MEKLLHERLLDYASIGERTFSAQEMRVLAEEIEKHYVPRPRYEDGEPVKAGENVSGESVGAICVYENGHFVIENDDGTMIEDAPYGFPVKRGVTPDGDGIDTRLGDAVWPIGAETGHSAEVLRCSADSIDVRWDDGVVDYVVSPKRFTHRDPGNPAPSGRWRQEDSESHVNREHEQTRCAWLDGKLSEFHRYMSDSMWEEIGGNGVYAGEAWDALSAFEEFCKTGNVTDGSGNRLS